MADLNQLMGSRLFPLDNWISNGNTGINQRLNELHIFSTTKTGRLDIAEILLKVTLNTRNQPMLVLLIFP
jgi:hypothetical protein